MNPKDGDAVFFDGMSFLRKTGSDSVRPHIPVPEKTFMGDQQVRTQPGGFCNYSWLQESITVILSLFHRVCQLKLSTVFSGKTASA
jgi:hypothetical protein